MGSLLWNVVHEMEEAVLSATKHTFPSIQSVAFRPPRDGTHGHVSTSVAIQHAGKEQSSPRGIAEHIAPTLESLKYVSSVEILDPGFLNIRFNNDFLGKVLQETEQDVFGTNQNLKGQVWRIEHTSPNPNKAMHIGHLRNNAIGMFLVRLCEYNGGKVVSEMVDNNRGIAMAKVMWGFLISMKKDQDTPTDISYWSTHKDAWFSSKEKGMSPDLFVHFCYIKGEEASENKQDEREIRDLVVRWEQGDDVVLNLWRHMLSYAYEGQERTLSRLCNRFDVVWHEHDHYTQGKRYVEEGLKKGVFETVEDGAVKTTLEQYGLSDTIVLKRDGTSLYITQDIALTDLKKKAGGERMLWVVGVDQSLAMRQMFAVCEQLGIGSLKEFTHVSYGYVGLKDEKGFKKMSSRKGTVVLIDDIIDETKKVIQKRFVADGKKPQEALSESLARSAALFSMLRVERNQDIRFDTTSVTDMKGHSAIYCLYTLVRAKSVLKKGEVCSLDDPTILNTIPLVATLCMFSFVLQRAQDDFSAHHLAQYAFDVCSEFNTWYASEHILDGSASEPTKIYIVRSFVRTLEKVLALLGVESVEEF